MNVVFMGTPEFAVPALTELIKNHHVSAVVTQPDKPRGRGKKVLPTPVKEVAAAEGIPVYQPKKFRDSSFIDELKSIPADVFVVVAYGRILPKSVLEIPRYGCINIHGSLLPAYRGPAPIQWSVINGDNQTGITIMYMDEGMDTGDMILQRRMDIKQGDTAGSMHDKLANLGAGALMEALAMAEEGTAVRIPQDHSKSTYAPMLKKEDGRINWAQPPEKIFNLVRGMNPWPSAYTFAGGDLYKIWAVKIVESGISGAVGAVTEISNGEGIIVQVGGGHIRIDEIQAHGGKRMRCADFLRGNTLPVGTIFS